MKASMAWQDFRHSNLVSTSTPQVRSGDGDDSDGAEEDGFLGANSNGPQEVMMEIMDKYVLAGEALAEKENDVRQLLKQVEAAKAANSDLEKRVAQLTTANEKLADDEGRWYSLARELENQMDIIKKGETYSLFQDKVDEAEARLEVATDATNTCRRRLVEVYSEVSTDIKGNNNNGGDEDVDEHRQHATVLEELHRLKLAAEENQDALAASKDALSSAELAKEEHAQELKLRCLLEAQISDLREEAATRELAARSDRDALRDASAKQAQELRQVLEALSAAETTAQVAEDARRAAVVTASTAEANVAGVLEDMKLAQEETQTVEGYLAETRAALEAAREEAKHEHEARGLAESRTQDLSGRIVQLERDLADSAQKIRDLTQVSQDCQREVAEATAKSAHLQAHANMQERRLSESSERMTELSDTLQDLRSQLDEKDAAISRTRSEVEKALQDASAASERAEDLQQEVERITMDASTTEREYAAHAERMHEDLQRMTADASAAEERAMRVEELQHELEGTKQMAAAAAEENVALANKFREELEAADVAATSASEELEALRQDLASANATAASAAQKSAMHTNELRQDLENANAALLAAQDNATSRQELERVTFALSDAEDEITRLNEARMAAEAKAERAERVREHAETELAALRQNVVQNDPPGGYARIGGLQSDSSSIVADQGAAAASQALKDANEDVLRMETRLSSANQAHEASRQQAEKLADEVRGLEALLSEARASSTRLEVVAKEQREVLQNSSMRVNHLEERLGAAHTDLDEKTRALERAEEKLAAMDASGTAVDHVGAIPSVNGDASADVLFGSPAPDYNANTCDDGREESTATANGVAPPSRSAEAEELQAHAEAMELELRYTLESFEGQLSAMAREKVAIQKQVKELNGQCTTLRKQVSHYKKVAKESEAQVEQMLELQQQQLCDAERAAESIRENNSNLRSANHDLKSKLEVLEADSANVNLERMWRESQDEVMDLRARLVDAEEKIAAKCREVAAKAQEEASVRELAATLEQRIQEAESEVLELKEDSRSTAEELSAALTNASELRCALSKVCELESIVGDLEGDKFHLTETTAALTRQVEQAKTKLEELQEMLRSVENEKAEMSRTVQDAEEERAALVTQLGGIATSVGCIGIIGEDAETSHGRVLDAITVLKEKLRAAEELLEAAAQALLQTVVEGEFGLDPGARWIIDGVNSLQRRLQVAELEISQRADVHVGDGLDGNAKVLEDLSGVLECDGNMMAQKVHELKILAHDLSELRVEHVKEIQQLKDDLAAASKRGAMLQVTVDSLTEEVSEAQRSTAEATEEVRREQARLREQSESFTVVVEKRSNGEGVKHPCVHDRRSSSHRKCSSLQLGASSTDGWLSEIKKQGHEVKFNGGAKPWSPVGGTERRKEEVETSGDANGGGVVTNPALPRSDGPEAPKSKALLTEIQALLGCTVDEVIDKLNGLQAARQQENSTTRMFVDLRQSYLNNMGIFASAISHEATCSVSPLLAQASELFSVGTSLPSSQEGLEVLHEATGILASFIPKSIAANAEVAEAALRQSQEEVATLNETIRKERLMMMAFRRWGHFYLALSNEALRKRTKEQNHARSQRDMPEDASLSIVQRPRTVRRRSSSAGRRSCGRGRLQLSSSEVQVMVEEEAESVARELAAKPSLSLVALADARKEMDKIAMKAQATLGVLYTQSPLTQDANVATDETMTPEMVEKPPCGKISGEIQNALQSPRLPSGANPNVSNSDVNMTMSAETASASGTTEGVLAPMTVPTMQTGQQQAESGGFSDPAELPEKDGADVKSGTEEQIPPLPTQPSPSPSLTPAPIGPLEKPDDAKAVNGTGPGHSGSGGIALTVNALGRTTGSLVEDGVSKKERAEFLRRQREERKANRKRGLQASASRAKPAEPTSSLGIRSRRISAPAIMPSTAGVVPGSADPSKPAALPRIGQASSESDSAQTSTIAVEDVRAAGRSQVSHPSMPPTGGAQLNTEQQHSSGQVVAPAMSDSPPTGDVDAVSSVAVRAPPPRMFNPTAVPPPIAPPNMVPSSITQQSRHPSMAFNVNETVERALTQARLEAGVAKRKAAFWRCRFRDLAVWAASFVVLAYASDHGFDDC